MGILLEIANRATDKTLARLEHEGGLLKVVLAEELENEMDLYLADQDIDKDLLKNVQL